MRKKVFIVICAVMLTVSSGLTTGFCREDASWLKSSYLQSIHDDCLVFLEGIEMFARRDYASFLETMGNSGLINKKDAENYIDEVRHFEKLLDSVYEEYVSFKGASLAAGQSGEAQPGGLASIEKKIFQMLAYSYLRTGDVIMANFLLENHDILSEKYTIQIRGMDGRINDFQLTEQLEALYKKTKSSLASLKLHVRNFLASDLQNINAYIKIYGYDTFNPVNVLYMEYYGRLFPELNAGEEKLIHLGQLIKLLDMSKYGSHAAITAKASGEKDAYAATYVFPVVKGDYEMVVKTLEIVASSDREDEIVIERLCFFMGLARTDFRNLKEAEQQQLQDAPVLDDDITLLKIDQEYVSFRPGQMMPYGAYAVFEKQQHLGTIELLPCYKGSECKKPAQTSPAVTPVRVFDHKFFLYRDVIDLVKHNHSLYGAEMALPELSVIEQSQTAAGKGGGKGRPGKPGEKEKGRIRLFPGCASTGDRKSE